MGIEGLAVEGGVGQGMLSHHLAQHLAQQVVDSDLAAQHFLICHVLFPQGQQVRAVHLQGAGVLGHGLEGVHHVAGDGLLYAHPGDLGDLVLKSGGSSRRGGGVLPGFQIGGDIPRDDAGAVSAAGADGPDVNARLLGHLLGPGRRPGYGRLYGRRS